MITLEIKGANLITVGVMFYLLTSGNPQRSGEPVWWPASVCPTWQQKNTKFTAVHKKKGKAPTDWWCWSFFLVVPHERTLLEWVLLWVTVKAGFLHCIDGVAQKLMGVLLAAKPEVAGNFWSKSTQCIRLSMNEQSDGQNNNKNSNGLRFHGILRWH